jgi:hypothetical protein
MKRLLKAFNNAVEQFVISENSEPCAFHFKTEFYVNMSAYHNNLIRLIINKGYKLSIKLVSVVRRYFATCFGPLRPSSRVHKRHN